MENAKRKTALIIAGGTPVEQSILARLDSPVWVVAADSGLDQANALGIRPDLVIGDMDSVTPAALAAAEAAGIDIERHPEDKDATDLELAIDAAANRGFARATIIGGTGGRIAHTVANTFLLTRKREIRLQWVTAQARIGALFSEETEIYAAAEGSLLSILAFGGAAICTSTGLRWPLTNHSLTPGKTRGVSNEIVERTAAVTVVSGQVLIVHERN